MKANQENAHIVHALAHAASSSSASSASSSASSSLSPFPSAASPAANEYTPLVPSSPTPPPSCVGYGTTVIEYFSSSCSCTPYGSGTASTDVLSSDPRPGGGWGFGGRIGSSDRPNGVACMEMVGTWWLLSSSEGWISTSNLASLVSSAGGCGCEGGCLSVWSSVFCIICDVSESSSMRAISAWRMSSSCPSWRRTAAGMLLRFALYLKSLPYFVSTVMVISCCSKASMAETSLSISGDGAPVLAVVCLDCLLCLAVDASLPGCEGLNGLAVGVWLTETRYVEP
mmetsp:Transcript_23144/g.57227  ORF Transcript_23144/g.57227 Transcript_23144/m.57227 type:complete len:284 (-) Transcript_23144:1094-1945(-)